MFFCWGVYVAQALRIVGDEHTLECVGRLWDQIDDAYRMCDAINGKRNVSAISQEVDGLALLGG